jgi:hypothetical protein
MRCGVGWDHVCARARDRLAASGYVGIKRVFEREYGGWKAVRPLEPIGAQMNVAYVVAVALLDGDVLIDQFSEDRINSDDMWNLIDRTETHHEKAYDQRPVNERLTTRVRLTLKDGSTRDRVVAHPRGTGDRMFTNADIVHKYQLLSLPMVATFSGPARRRPLFPGPDLLGVGWVDDWCVLPDVRDRIQPPQFHPRHRHPGSAHPSSGDAHRVPLARAGYGGRVIGHRRSHVRRTSNSAVAASSSKMITHAPVTCGSSTISPLSLRSTTRLAKPLGPRCSAQLTGIALRFSRDAPAVAPSAMVDLSLT